MHCAGSWSYKYQLGAPGSSEGQQSIENWSLAVSFSLIVFLYLSLRQMTVSYNPPIASESNHNSKATDIQ